MAVKTIYSMLPDADALISLEPEELAGIVLEHIKSHSGLSGGYVNRYNFGLAGNTYSEFPFERQGQVGKALMEAWMWLEREVLIAPKLEDTGLWSTLPSADSGLMAQWVLKLTAAAQCCPRSFFTQRLL